MAEADLHLQLVLKDGETLETATGRKSILDDKPIHWNAEEIGEWIRHRGWTLKIPAGARLIWPVYPFSPYRNSPEADLTHAVGTLSFSLTGKNELVFQVETN